MRKKFGYQAMAAIFAAAMIVSGAGMYQTTAKAAEGQIRTPQQKTAVETQESAKLKADAASVDPTEDGEYTLTFEAKQEGSDEESMLAGYFDPKAKLTVENGKMYVTFLNTKLSDFLLDFTVASDGTYTQTEKTGFGEPDGCMSTRWISQSHRKSTKEQHLSQRWAVRTVTLEILTNTSRRTSLS